MVYFLGIDIGTYESKGTLIDKKGNVIATLSQPHGLEMPHPGWYEHDAENVWWRDFCRLSSGLIEKTGIHASSIAGVGVSALNACCVPVDKSCRPLRKAILYGIDSRAQKELAFLNNYYGPEKILAMKGTEMNSEDVIARMLWLKNNEPEIYEKAFKLCTSSTYVTAKLTGEFVVDRYLAKTCFFPIYDDDGNIRVDMVEPLLAVDKMARCAHSTDIVGYVTKQAAIETGLAEGTPVITGTDDAAAEALSVGVLSPGDVMVMLGSSMYMICVVDTAFQDSRLWKCGYLRTYTNTVQGATNNAGTLTRWLRDNLYPEFVVQESTSGINAYARMMEKGSSISPGADGLLVLPYFAGERTPINDPNACGVIFGLNLRHTRDHLYRACLEGVGYSIAQHFDILRENNIMLKNIFVVGGGTKNSLWMQILSDITDYSFQTSSVTIGASYGDALLAAIGTGAIEGFDSLRNIIKRDRIYTPIPDNNIVYKEYLKLFNSLYPATRQIMHAIKSIAPSLS